MIDILYRKSRTDKDISDLLRIEVCEHFGDDFEAVVKDVLHCYKCHNIVITVYLTSKPWRTHKKGSGAVMYRGLTKPGVPEIRLGLHTRYQMLLTLFHELEHLKRPPIVNLSEKQRQREECYIERQAKSMYCAYLARQQAVAT